MINLYSNDNNILYGIKHLLADTSLDLLNLDKSRLSVGTTAFVIDTSKYYILNGTKHWVKINPFGGSVEDNDETDQLLYDGGSIDNSDPM